MSVSTTSSDPVETVLNLLTGYSGWSNATPGVEFQHESSQQTKQNRPDPYIYVWSPVDADLQQFDGEHSAISEFETVEASVWVLSGTGNAQFRVAQDYQDEMVDFLQQYAGDNEENTTFHQVRPTSKSDYRHENVARRTDHYVMSVTCTLHNHRD